MSASQSDKFKKVGASTVTSLAAPGKALGATSITVGSTTNYPTDTGIVIAIRVVDTAGKLVAGTYTEYTATVTSATSLAISASPIYGSDQVYASGSTTQVYIPVSYKAHNGLIDALLIEHGQDGKHTAVTATSVTATGTVQGATLISTGDVQRRNISTETIDSEHFFDYVASGLVWSGDAYGSTLNASMTAGVVYINGRRGTISAVTARAFTASKDTYIDVLNNSGTFSLVYTEVTNNAASPALAANSIRIGIIVTGASNIAAAGSVNQGQEDRVLPIASSIAYSVTDSLGNLICPRDPTRKLLGQRQILATFNNSSTTHVQIPGLSVPVIGIAGRKVKITLTGDSLYNTLAGGAAIADIWNGVVVAGTKLSETTLVAASANQQVPLSRSVTFTMTSNSPLTFNASLAAAVGGFANIFASATSPAILMVELA